MKKFNKDKYLKKLKLKRFWQNNSRYFYIGVPCILCGILGIYFAYSKFFVSQGQEVVRATVAPFIRGDVVINNYINGQLVDDVPAKATGYKVDKIVCDNGAVGEWNGIDWGPTISNVTRRSKCNIYFVPNDKINIGNVELTLDEFNECPSLNEDGSINVTKVEYSKGYICKAKDVYGDSYYYRGVVTNNYVKFADKYWRIVRINGDGTVRVIYDGTSAHANGESNEDRQIGPSAFNSGDKDNAYVGYMYGKIGASTYTAAHANTNDSIIKTYLDNWYKTNISGTSNEQYLADNIFCNDRSLASGTGFGQSSAYYRGQSLYGSVKNVTLSCSQKNDAFTVNDIINGNGALTYGIGLITADEVILAKDNYLNSGYDFWTMTPSDYNDDVNLAYILIERNFNGIYITAKSSAWSFVWQAPFEDSVVVRPVLNLKPEVLKYGDGTASNPYRLIESLDNSSSSESGGIDTGD